MNRYKQTISRTQMCYMSLDELVGKHSDARIIDEFVEGLDLVHLGIYTATPSKKGGNSAYNPKAMLKLYIYGYKKNLQSSRDLMDACKINIEVKWLMDYVEPNFRTISLFRKKNADCMKEVFHEFNKLIAKAVKHGDTSIDGSKFQANNARNKTFTLSYLDNKIKWLDEQSEEYLKKLDESDLEEENPSQLSIDKIEEKLNELSSLLNLYKGYRQQMLDTNQTQLSLTDPDARLMKTKSGLLVAYNSQTAVDTQTHLILDFNMTNNPTDHGQLYQTMEKIRQENPNEILQITADMGYRQPEDIAKCLENGIIPNVINSNESGTFEIVIPYEENSNCNPESTIPDDLRQCLHAGIVPEAYKDVISNMSIDTIEVDANNTKYEDLKSPYGTVEQMMERASEGYFVFDPLNMAVYCPAKNILRRIAINDQGMIKFANKVACHYCPYKDKCGVKTTGFKTVSFNKNYLEKPNNHWLKSENKGPEKIHKEPKNTKLMSVVKFVLKPIQSIMKKRKCVSEHPFGTLKRAMGAGYFLMRGIKNVTGEFALSALGYNITVAKNLLGFNKLMNLMKQ